MVHDFIILILIIIIIIVSVFFFFFLLLEQVKVSPVGSESVRKKRGEETRNQLKKRRTNDFEMTD